MKPEALQEKLNELNVLQQRLSIFTQQRQQLELSNAEITTSAEEVSKAKGKVYSLTGNVILEKDAKTLKTELETQKKKELDCNMNGQQTWFIEEFNVLSKT